MTSPSLTQSGGKNTFCSKSRYRVNGGSLSSPVAAISISCGSHFDKGEAASSRTHLDSNAAESKGECRFLLTRNTPRCRCSRPTVWDPRTRWSWSWPTSKWHSGPVDRSLKMKVVEWDLTPTLKKLQETSQCDDLVERKSPEWKAEGRRLLLERPAPHTPQVLVV